MPAFRWLRGRPRTMVGAGIVTIGAMALAGAAWAYQGEPTTQVDLNDGSVWVTKQSDLMVGHFNHPSALLDGGLHAASDDYDIVQSGQHVLLHDATNGTVGVIDPANMKVGASAKLAGSADVEVGGATAAVLDQSSGALWVMPAASAGSFKPASATPQAKLGRGAAMTVGTDGTVYAVSPGRREIITVPTDGQGRPAAVQRKAASGIQPTSTVSITAVGDTPVVLDRAHASVILDGSRTVKVAGTGDGAALQQPGAANDVVLLETKDALVRVGLDSGAVSRTAAGGIGAPVSPVYLQGCAYAVWDSSHQFVRDCVGTGHDMHMQVSGASSGAQMRFRVNRDVIVLNDIREGGVWLAGDSMNKVDNWSDLAPPSTRTKDTDSKETVVTTTLPKRTKQNHQPTAVNDAYGVRPGRTTILPVLENDSDPDGDVLTVSLPKGGPKLGAVTPITDGSALQIAVPADARGSDSFRYQVSDGRGGHAEATVKLTVHPNGTNEAPTQRRVTTVQVESGASVSYNVLPDWRDPDGDDIYLAAVQALPGDQADFTADGRVTYRSISGLTGKHDIKITVSDGDKSTDGVLRLDIRPVGSADPVANADHVQVKVGQSTTVKPLVNDISTSSDPLRLTRVAAVSGSVIVPDYDNSTFSFRSNAVGVYYVQYEIASRGRPASSVVRVDVVADRQTNAAPTAVRDVALLPRGGDVLVDVLANDTDPNDGVLVTQNVQVTPGSGVTAAIINHNDVRITDAGSTSTTQVQVQYTVSNGLKTATGMISVIRVQPPDKLRPPVATDDTATVRVGDVVTIPVLANDYSPTGTTIHVAPQLVPPLVDGKDGEAFVSQDTVRFKAGSTAKTVHLTYSVIDANGQKDAGYVTIQIVPMNVKNNSAPRPLDVTGRTIAGAQQRIAVPLDGIDPDGDSVELVGLASAPTKGRVVAVGQDYLQYQAFATSSGVDTFTYTVRDRLGATGTATVRVGIAAASAVNHAPYAIKDSVVMRPGRQIAVPVLANDSDPDGDTIGLVRGGLTVPKLPGLAAVVSGDRVVVTAPDQELTTQVQYTVRDSKGAESTGVIMVKVDKKVALLAPIARDDQVAAAQVKGSAKTVDVDVRANDDDPDGVRTDLNVTADSGTVLPNGSVRVTLTDQSQLIRYTDTDPDNLTASAFIHVPSLADLPPTLRSSTPIKVKSGQLVAIPLSEHVVAAGGKAVRITEAAKVSAVHADGGSLLKDATTLQYRSSQGYVGGDAITFEVTDGTSPDDPNGRKATLTIPITVTPGGHVPPTFTNAQVDVAPGDDPAVVDLKALTKDADPGDLATMRYSIAGAVPAGLSAHLDGSRLQVSAPANTRKGTQGTIRLSITDGSTTPVAGSVTATVTASTKAMPIAVEDDVAEAHQGATVMVPVLKNDFNPFQAQGKSLKITGTAVQTGAVTPTIAGDQVRVTIGDHYVGRAVVGYTIEDATGDPDRAVDGKIVLTVQGKPDAPGTPAVTSVQNRTVVLSWSPPADNGAEITGYTVKSNTGGYQKTCQATTCTLDGLTNNVAYTFTVAAVNSVGTGAASPPSQTARPDASPDQPQPPALTFGDGSLKVGWQAPPTPGSPVTSYNLEISPAPPGGQSQQTGVTGTSTVWKGLENGVSYQVRVQAVNRAPDPSSWSSWSSSEVPAKAPAAPAAPTTTNPSPVGGQAQVTVAWNPAADNGDAVSAYEVQALRGGSVVGTASAGGSATSTNFALNTSSTSYTFRVHAKNKAGWGDWSAASAPRRAVTTPGAPTSVQASPGDNRVTVSFAAGEGHGVSSGETRYQYLVTGAPWTGSWTSTTGNVISSGVTNNNTYQIRVRAVATVDGVTYTSDPSAPSNSVAPYGTPGAPSVTASVSGSTITFSWSPPTRNGVDITGAITSIDGSQQTGAASGSRSIDAGWGGTKTISVQAKDAKGNLGPTVNLSASTPPPHMWASKGSLERTGGGTCSPSECWHGVLNYQHLPGGNYVLQCYDDEPGSMETVSPSSYKRTLSGDGSVELPCFYGGRGGTHLWVRVLSGPWVPSGGYSDAATW